LVTADVATRFGGDRAAARREAIARLAAALELPASARRTPDLGRGLARLALLLALIPDLPAWPRADRRRLVRVPRAQRGPGDAEACSARRADPARRSTSAASTPTPGCAPVSPRCSPTPPRPADASSARERGFDGLRAGTSRAERRRALRPAAARAGRPTGQRLGVLCLTALGVVYGDIGTSPLYALRACLSPIYGRPRDATSVYGVLSLIVWSLILVVSVKYVLVIMRLDNRGEGGIVALLALLLQRQRRGLL